MASDDVSMDMKEVSKTMSITVRLTGVTKFRFRMWCVAQLLRVVAMIAPVSVFIEIEGP